VGDLDLFANAGDGLRPEHFGIHDDGRAYVEAPAFARAMGYSSTQKALQVVDDDEKGQLGRLTPGGKQVVSIIFEDGIWELIFRSTLPTAKAIKTRVKAILAQLRRGELTRMPTHSEALRGWADAMDRAALAEQKVAELEPAAHSWEQLADASGDYSLREAAQILDRDPSIRTGQNRLSKYLKNIGWTDHSGQPYQRHVDAGRLARRTVPYLNRSTGEQELTTQLRITAKGLADLHREMGGTGPLMTVVAS
jgi:anti-repressor protein